MLVGAFRLVTLFEIAFDQASLREDGTGHNWGAARIPRNVTTKNRHSQNGSVNGGPLRWRGS